MSTRMEELVEKLNSASEAYYNGKDEIMSNFEWDAMFDELVELEKQVVLFYQIVQLKIPDMLKRGMERKSSMSF